MLKLTALVIATLMLSACAARPGEVVAERIRAAQSDAIGDVHYRETFIDPPEVLVYLREGTEGEANAVWCEVIMPAGGSSAGDSEVTVWDSAGSVTFSQPETCP